MLYHCLACANNEIDRSTRHRHCNVGHFPDRSTEDCRCEFRYERNNVRGYFCTYHQQWVHEHAVDVKYIFESDSEDGTRPFTGRENERAKS